MMTTLLKNDRRSSKDRRSGGDRRQYNDSQYSSYEKRRAQVRRIEKDRRNVQLFMPEL